MKRILLMPLMVIVRTTASKAQVRRMVSRTQRLRAARAERKRPDPRIRSFANEPAWSKPPLVNSRRPRSKCRSENTPSSTFRDALPTSPYSNWQMKVPIHGKRSASNRSTLQYWGGKERWAMIDQLLDHWCTRLSRHGDHPILEVFPTSVPGSWHQPLTVVLPPTILNNP